MKVIITGSMGFIGGALMTKLKAKGHGVLGIDKKTGVDLLDINKVLTAINQIMPDFDMIVHLAANCSTQKSIDNPATDFADNAGGTFHVLEIARRLKKPVIFASSCKVQPNSDGIHTPYGLSKRVGEMYTEEWHKVYGVEYIIDRFGTVYGENQKGSPESGWLSWFIQATVETLPVTIYGDGKQTRDVLYIDDAVELLSDQVDNFQKYKNKTYEVGGGKENEISLLQACEILGFKNYNFGRERLGDVKRYVADNTKVTAVNGWKPKIDYKTGILKVLEFEKKASKNDKNS